MILKKRVDIPLKGITYIEGALLMKDSRVMVFSADTDKEQAMINVFDDKGKQLAKFSDLKGEVRHFTATSNTEAIGLVPGCGQWVIVDSDSLKIRKGKFIYQSESAFRARLLYFPESKVLCIWEVVDFNDKRGKFSFLHYPPKENEVAQPFFTTTIDNVFNHEVRAFNTVSRVGLWEGKVDSHFKWTVIDFLQKEKQKQTVVYSVPKTEMETESKEFCQKTVIELQHEVFLLDTQAMHTKDRYQIFRHGKINRIDWILDPQDTLFDLYQVGPWIYAVFFNVDQEGKQLESVLKIISKREFKLEFETNGFIGQGTQYFVMPTNEFNLLRVDMVHHDPERVGVETLRITSQAQLYHFLMLELNPNISNAMCGQIMNAFGDA